MSRKKLLKIVVFLEQFFVMSIKVYLHYELDGVPHKTLKLSVPKKWVSEKAVSNVIELFTDSYNKVNPDHSINKDEVHLVNNSGEKIYSSAIIGDFLQDRYDYFIKPGCHVESVFRVAPTAQTSQLRCRNYGCGQHFDEENNTDTSCRHHVAPPIFHDCVKGWSCCKDRKAYDWEEFQRIEGCTIGRHSTVDPQLLFAASPTVSAASAAEANSPSPAPPQPVLKSIADFNQQNPDAASAASSAAKVLNAPRKSTRKEDGTAKCQNKGCQKDFVVVDNTSSACTYHAGQPIFHDAIKFWSCCPNKKCYDFESFLAVPGCATGYHDDGVIDLCA
jgi:hypothetical protein